MSQNQQRKISNIINNSSNYHSINSNKGQMACGGYKWSLILVIIAVTGVQSAMEETSPIEQYSDSGDTIYKPALAALNMAVKGTSGQNQKLASLPIRIEELEDSDDDLIAEIKRTQSWNQLHGGWGKRVSPVDSNDGPGGSNWNRMNNLWGKRANWNNLNSGWGKRASWNQLQNGWGKRNSPHWNNLRNMWGRK